MNIQQELDILDKKLGKNYTRQLKIIFILSIFAVIMFLTAIIIINNNNFPAGFLCIAIGVSIVSVILCSFSQMKSKIEIINENFNEIIQDLDLPTKTQCLGISLSKDENNECNIYQIERMNLILDILDEAKELGISNTSISEKIKIDLSKINTKEQFLKNKNILNKMSCDFALWQKTLNDKINYQKNDFNSQLHIQNQLQSLVNYSNDYSKLVKANHINNVVFHDYRLDNYSLPELIEQMTIEIRKAIFDNKN